MGKQTGIEWCDATYNPWRGCDKVSEGCAHCYAETQSKRNPRVLGEWGANARRAPAAESYLNEPFRWDRMAGEGVCWNCHGKSRGTVPETRCPVCEGGTKEIAPYRRKVFCGSLMDVWEPRADLHEYRARLFDTIATTPHLDWLLLSKRPEHWERCLVGALAQLPNLSSAAERLILGWLSAYYRGAGTHCSGNRGLGVQHLADLHETAPEPPANVWIGATVENQKRAADRCDALTAIPANRRFVSAEPLLDLPELRPYLNAGVVNWVIVGGESGSKARPFQMNWARALRDQCGDAGVAFFMKQTGDNHDGIPLAVAGDTWAGIPPDLRVREFPQ